MDISNPGLRFARSPEQLSCELDDEIAILNLGSKLYFGLTDVAATVWREIEAPKSLKAIMAAVMDEYNVDAEHCRQGVVDFLSNMRDRGLLEVSEGVDPS